MNINLKNGEIIDLHSGNCNDYRKLISSFLDDGIEKDLFYKIYIDIHNNCNLFSEMMFLHELELQGIKIELLDC